MKKLLIQLAIFLTPALLFAEPSINGNSLFNSKSEWRDTQGQKLELVQFRNSKVLLTMAYTSCTFTCPLTVAKLKEIESSLLKKGVKDFKIVLASFDPKHDSPANLAKYQAKKELSERWVLLSPKSDKDVRELAALMGISYKQGKGGNISHSNVISFMDGEGVIRETLNGLAADPKALISAIAGG